MSTGYNAGLDSSDVIVRYGEEAIWDAVPTLDYQNVRLTGESFAEQKTRTRPEEINALGYAAHALTTQVQATGALNFALSYGSASGVGYNDLLEGLVNGDFTAELTIQSVAGTGIITAYDGGTTPLPNLTGAGFAFGDAQGDAIAAGQWFRVSGYGTATDGIYRCTAVDLANDEVQVSLTAGDGATIVDQDVSTAAEVFIEGSMLRNGVSFHSYSFEKQLSANKFLYYGGSYISDGNLTAQVGGFLEGAFNFLCASEGSGTATLSDDTPIAAPTGRVIDTVAGFSNLEINDVVTPAVVQGISWNAAKNNARAQYGLGASNAQGMARGTLEVSGSMSVYFIDFDLYDLYTAETDQLISFRALDDLGQGYIFTLPAVTLMNPQIVAGGPDTDLVSEFELEGNASPTGTYAGVVIQVDRIPAGSG